MKTLVCFLISLLCMSCNQKQKSREVALVNELDSNGVFLEAVEEEQFERQPISKTAKYLDSLGLVNLSEIDSTIIVDLMYAKPDNFTGEILYDDLTEAYLLPHVAEAVVGAQQLLKLKHPTYSLIIYDAARPMSVQQKMWDVVKDTPKYRYVSNPSRGGGLHNYGRAVDVSIVDSLGVPLPMGTSVDHLGVESHITNEEQNVIDGVITSIERENRVMLRRIMCKVGFTPLASEWWHFNWCSRREAKENHIVIE